MNPEVRSQNSESGKEANPRPPAKSFEQLIVWQKAHQFVLGVYRFTDGFPRNEIYGLTSQLRRAAVSIPANIAEGFKKRGRPDKVRFMNIAQGSLEECRYYLILAKDLNYGDTTQLHLQLTEVSKLLEAYSAKILTSGF
jgi:four helix bundle protein